MGSGAWRGEPAGSRRGSARLHAAAVQCSGSVQAPQPPTHLCLLPKSCRPPRRPPRRRWRRRARPRPRRPAPPRRRRPMRRRRTRRRRPAWRPRPKRRRCAGAGWVQFCRQPGMHGARHRPADSPTRSPPEPTPIHCAPSRPATRRRRPRWRQRRRRPRRGVPPPRRAWRSGRRSWRRCRTRRRACASSWPRCRRSWVSAGWGAGRQAGALCAGAGARPPVPVLNKMHARAAPATQPPIQPPTRPPTRPQTRRSSARTPPPPPW